MDINVTKDYLEIVKAVAGGVVAHGGLEAVNIKDIAVTSMDILEAADAAIQARRK